MRYNTDSFPSRDLWDCFRWKAELIRVIDGDTIVVMAHILHNQLLKIHLRFARINAPEMHGEEKMSGLVSKEALEELLGTYALYIEVYSLDTFGSRYVTELYIEKDEILINVNDELAEAGFAAYAQSRDLEPASWFVESGL